MFRCPPLGQNDCHTLVLLVESPLWHRSLKYPRLDSFKLHLTVSYWQMQLSFYSESLSERDALLETHPTTTSLLNPSKPCFSHSVFWNKTIVTTYLLLSDISIALPLRNSACIVCYKIILILCLYCVLKCFYCCSAVPQVSWLQSAVSATGLLLCLGKHWKIGLLVLPKTLEQALNICINTHARVHINNRQVHAHPYIHHNIVLMHLNLQQTSSKCAEKITLDFSALEDLRLSLNANLSSFIASPDFYKSFSCFCAAASNQENISHFWLA